MKFEEFKKYKMMVESQDTELLQQYPEAEKIHAWMEETGRIDEGFWGAIWSWLKRNLSPTARKLNNLADEYEKELEAEMQAEYGKLKNSKDLDAKFRRSFAGRIAEDIDEKMDIVAGDDEDYRELKKNLINKKNLKVKKKLIKELIGRIDPDDLDPETQELYKRTGVELDDATRKVDSSFSKINTQNPETVKQASEALRKRMSGEKIYIEMGYDSADKVQGIIKKLLVYQNSLATLGAADFTVKAVETTLKNFREFIIAGAKKLESSKLPYKNAILLIVEATEKRLVKDKPVVFSKMQSEVFKEAETKAKELTKTSTGTPETPSGESTELTEPEKKAEKAATGPLTTTIIEPKEVDDTVKQASTATGSPKASESEIIKELDDAVKTYYKDNEGFFLTEVTRKVEEFNKLSEADRNKQKGQFEYVLNNEKKLDLPNAKIISSLYKNLLQVAGKVVPFYNLEKGKRSKAFYIVLDFMFEIYAIKKTDTGDLSDDNIETLAANIKEKYD